MEPVLFSQEIGILAGIFFVVAYALVNFGMVTTKSRLYQALNLVGALGFVYTAFVPFNPGLLITYVVWGLVAAVVLGKISRQKKVVPAPVADDAPATDDAPALATAQTG